MMENLLKGLAYVLGWEPLLIITIGIIVGIFVGAMPGLSPSMGVALLVPFTYGMSPTLALILLVSIYLAASYGGSITAITINTPGTSSAVVTGFDGYPLTQQGKPEVALSVSLVVSAVAGILGTIILIVCSVPLAAIAVRFHPAEYFALALFGLATVVSLAGKLWAKAFLAAMFGLLLNTVGTDPISGSARFTFGITPLSDGFALIPALIGLFALSEVFTSLEKKELSTKVLDKMGQAWPKLKDYLKLKWVTLWASLVGTVVGIFPGAGATIAAFIAYDFAKRTSKRPDEFGKGSVEGIAAAEAANSASVGGAMVPLLTLGIPGSATTAVLIGAMMIHKLTPGPQLFISKPNVIYGLFAALLVGNFVLLAIGFLGAKLWVKVTAVPKPVLFALILVMGVIGSYAVRNSMFDVVCCVAFGLMGWVFKRYNYPLAPVILGMVLGSIAETNFRRAIMMDGSMVFFTRPVSAIMLGLALLSFALPLYAAWKENKEKLPGASAQA